MDQINKLKHAQYPLPASLFSGDADATWKLLDKKMSLTQINNMIGKQIGYGSKLYTFICFHMGNPDEIFNPFRGNPTAAQIMAKVHAMQTVEYDVNEVERWMTYFRVGLEPDTYLVPTAFCGDDGATTCNDAFTAWFLPAFIIALYPYVVAYNLATEASKTMGVSRQERALKIMRDAFDMASPPLPPKPLAVHLQWNGRTPLPKGMDVLIYEFSWNPKYGHEKSVQEVVTELQDRLNHLPPDVLIWPQELAVQNEHPRAREQSRAIRDMAKTENRIIGLPGPT